MIELQVIKSFLNKDTWNEFRKYVDKKTLTKELNVILDILDTYYSKHDNSLSVSEFEIVCETSNKIDKTHRAILETMHNEDVNPDLVEELLKSYKQKSVLSQLALVAYDASEGRKKREDVDKIIKQLETVDELTNLVLEPVTDDIEQLLNETYLQTGLRWRLDALNKSIGSLRKGDFGFVFARPETGKTTFLASEITKMAEQAERPVLWFNNEEQSNKVKLRCIQALLGLTNVELQRDPKGAQQEYDRRIQGRLLLYDVVSATAKDIEQICKHHEPSLIVFDQIDKIKGWSNDREDLRLGSVYQWAREMAKTYGPVIGITQADGTGDNQRWLTMNHVANAKTSKQAEADWILGIGKVDDIGFEQVRFLNISKNKLSGDEDTIPELRHGRMDVLINPYIGRYEDMPR